MELYCFGSQMNLINKNCENKNVELMYKHAMKCDFRLN